MSAIQPRFRSRKFQAAPVIEGIRSANKVDVVEIRLSGLSCCGIRSLDRGQPAIAFLYPAN